mmetsp:Transcript_147005/g.409517  ORF Transcript_147005/g.409517 Transcript_147005/m.409517 type:complete len:206 (-) Transcript_147005:342-959(-)
MAVPPVAAAWGCRIGRLLADCPGPAKLTATGEPEPNLRPWKNLASTATSSDDLARSTAQPRPRCTLVRGSNRTSSTDPIRPLASNSASRPPAAQSCGGSPRRCRALRRSRWLARAAQSSAERLKLWTLRGPAPRGTAAFGPGGAFSGRGALWGPALGGTGAGAAPGATDVAALFGTASFEPTSGRTGVSVAAKSASKEFTVKAPG